MPENEEKPIRQSVRVDCPIEDAFRLFTGAFSEWWPLAMYSIGGNEAETCGIEPWVGGRVFERSRSGEECEWGVVIRCDPPNRLSFTWDPAGLGDSRQTVDVDFETDADGTQLTLTHTGWASPGVAVCTLQEHGGGMWAVLLRQFFFQFVAEQLVVAG